MSRSYAMIIIIIILYTNALFGQEMIETLKPKPFVFSKENNRTRLESMRSKDVESAALADVGLGEMYYLGLDGPVQYSEALSCFERAFDQRIHLSARMQACYWLGHLHASGRYISLPTRWGHDKNEPKTADSDRALAYLKQASEQKNDPEVGARALIDLAQFYKKKAVDCVYNQHRMQEKEYYEKEEASLEKGRFLQLAIDCYKQAAQQEVDNEVKQHAVAHLNEIALLFRITRSVLQKGSKQEELLRVAKKYFEALETAKNYLQVTNYLRSLLAYEGTHAWAWAHCYLGQIYKDMTPDYDLALHHFGEAARQKINEEVEELANCFLGEMLYNGRNSAANNIETALPYFQRAYKQNVSKKAQARATYHLGIIAFYKYRDVKKALEYFESAAEQEVDRFARVHACSFLADYYTSSGTSFYCDKEENWKKARPYLERLIDPTINPVNTFARLRAYTLLGEMYHYGLGVSRNYNRAMEFFSKALEGTVDPCGKDRARVHLGEMHFRGQGVSVNLDQALTFLKQVNQRFATLHIRAALIAGAIYKSKNNFAEARKFYEYVTAQKSSPDHSAAAKALAEIDVADGRAKIAEYLKSHETNNAALQAALTCFERVANNDQALFEQAEACFELAQHYRHRKESLRFYDCTHAETWKKFHDLYMNDLHPKAPASIRNQPQMRGNYEGEIARKFLEEYSKKNGISVEECLKRGQEYFNKAVAFYEKTARQQTNVGLRNRAMEELAEIYFQLSLDIEKAKLLCEKLSKEEYSSTKLQLLLQKIDRHVKLTGGK